MTAALLLAALLAGSAAARGGVLEALPPPPKTDSAKAELGRTLFSDYRLSGDGTLSCASCHAPHRAFTDGRALSEGYPSTRYFRNTPTLLNAAGARYLYWDGRLPGSDLATVVRDHLSEAHFMQADGRLLIERLRQIPDYERRFKVVLGGEVSYGKILAAIAEYLKTLRSGETPYDRHLKGESEALSEGARRGLALFTGRAGCARCHHGPLLSDGRRHVSGVPENPEAFTDPLRHITLRRFLKTLGVERYAELRRDPGYYALTKAATDLGAFRTPSLRETGRTAPYMHNGVFSTLAEVVDFYAERDRLGLSERDKGDLVEFLGSLSSPAEAVRPPALPRYALRELGRN